MRLHHVNKNRLINLSEPAWGFLISIFNYELWPDLVSTYDIPLSYLFLSIFLVHPKLDHGPI